VQVLSLSLARPLIGNISDQDYFFHPHSARKRRTVAVRLKDLSPGKYRLTIYRIGYYCSDPSSLYLEMGNPTDLSPESVAELNDLSTENRPPKPLSP
jgi:xylan 1,4-beta-xylosidase